MTEAGDPTPNDTFDDIRLRELLFFDRLVHRGTITAAAAEMGLPKPTGSRWLATLETRVGRPLVRRGARRIALTERGQAFHQELQPLLRCIRALRTAGRDEQPGGTLRISVPTPFSRLVGGGVIAAFRRQMPRVRLEVILDNKRADLLAEGIDLAIRGGRLPDSDLIARRLATVRMWHFASRRFADRDMQGVPFVAAPGDAAALRLTWATPPTPAVVVDDRIAVCEALRGGAGAGVLPGFLGQPHLESGELIRVSERPVWSVPVHAIFLPEQRKDARVQVLVELVKSALAAWSD